MLVCRRVIIIEHSVTGTTIKQTRRQNCLHLTTLRPPPPKTTSARQKLGNHSTHSHKFATSLYEQQLCLRGPWRNNKLTNIPSMVGKPNRMVSQHHHFEYVIIPIPISPRYMPCRISIKALRATMASSSADIRLTNLEVAMNEDVSWLSKSENLGNLPDSQKFLEFGILDVDSQCSPFTQKKLIGAKI